MKNNSIQNLSDDLEKMVGQINNLHHELFTLGIKDKEYRKATIKLRGIMITLDKVLVDIKSLKALDTDICLCYENNINLSFMNGRYVISEINNDDIEVLFFTKKLKKALEYFYSRAYKVNKKALKKINIDEIEIIEEE